MTLNDIVGQLHAKRAIEVAWAGGHSITLIGNENASQLAQWCQEQGISAKAIMPCYCGHYPSFVYGRCTPARVARWQSLKRWPKAMLADIVIECYMPTEGEIEDWEHRRTEAWARAIDEAMRQRIAAMGRRPPIMLDELGDALLKAARAQLQLTEHRVNAILAVAQTIAALAHQDSIGCVDLAEAIAPVLHFTLGQR